MSVVTFTDVSDIYFFQKNEIVRAISLALIGWVLFIIGAILANRKKNKYFESTNNKIEYNASKIRIFFHCCCFLIMIYFIINDGVNYVNRYKEGGELSSIVFWLTLIIVLSSFYEFTHLNKKNIKTLKTFLININKLYLITVLITSAFFLITGNRSEVLQFFLPIIFLYHIFIKKIRTKYLFIFIILALFLFAIIREERAGENVQINSEFIKIENLTKDLVPANAALPVLINYTEQHGSANGYNAFLQIISIVPFFL